MSDFPEKAEDKVNTLAIVAIGLATTVILWASVVALQAYFENTEGEIASERAAQGLTSGIRDLDSLQRAALTKTEYADASKGTLKHLPIDLAKAAVIDAAAQGTSMIPSLGELNVATVPAVPGKPADDAKIETPPATPDGAAPVDPATGVAAPDAEGADEAAASPPSEPATEPAAAPTGANQ